MIRIIAGESKGRKLLGPKGMEFRPTTGIVKEFIFSYLINDIESAAVLDLFSGTGSIGIEALSRGAARVVFIEQSAAHGSILKQNLELCNYKSLAEIIRGDVFSLLKSGRFKPESFGIVIADPPFKRPCHNLIVRDVSKSGILEKDGLLLIEHESHDQSDESSSGLLKIKERRFGQSVVTVYRAK